MGLVQRIAKAEEEDEWIWMPPSLAKSLGQHAKDAPEGFDGRTRLPKEHPLLMLRKNEYELDRAMKEQIEKRLDRERRREVSVEREGWTRFVDWTPGSLKREPLAPPLPCPHVSNTLATNLAGLQLRNPVLLAAGTAGTLDEMADALDLSRVGGLVTKSITALPREGNNTWRILPNDVGMLNAVGLANVGIDAFMRDIAPRIGAMPAAVIGSVAGFSIEDYVRVSAAFDSLDALAAVELNVSCPNVHHGTEYGADPAMLADLIREVRRVLPRKRLFVKLSPIAIGRVTLVDVARAAIEPPNSLPTGPNMRPGADVLCISNTIPAMAIDVHTRKPLLANRTGGLSGPALHPVAVRLVHDLHSKIAKSTNTPIIGIGGVMRWEHAAEFILAGASAIQMGTALFADPRSPLRVIRGLETWVHAQNCTSISQLTGGLR